MATVVSAGRTVNVPLHERSTIVQGFGVVQLLDRRSEGDAHNLAVSITVVVRQDLVKGEY